MPTSLPDAAAIEFRVDLARVVPGELVRLGQAIQVLVREAGQDAALEEWDRVRQNYLRYPMEDGRCLVVEVVARYASANPGRASQRIGFPLGMLERVGVHVVTLRVLPAHLQLLVEGRLVDEEWPVDPLVGVEGEPVVSPEVPDFTIRADEQGPAYPDLTQATRAGRQPPPLPLPSATADLRQGGGNKACATSMQYFTPPGHNVWAGDTMCLVYQDRFHLFYLLDRRHGSSKFGCGAHQVAHASSADLRTWEHHPLALPIRDEPWLTYGTGVPIVRDGKIQLFYGMHTDRVVPHEQTITPYLQQQLERDGVTQPVPFFDQGKYPMGSAIATSEDGLHFTQDPTVVHLCQNPSPFQDPATGKAYLLAGYGDHGLYVSDDLQRWTLVDRHFLPMNEETPQGNTLECQCHFEWNGWYYIIAGRTGFWMSRNVLGPFWEGAEGAKEAGDAQITRPKWDIYDGLWVPMAAAWKGNRRILSGWMTGPDVDYAGHLVFRELVQHEDGNLGMRWVEEMVPAAGEPVRPAVTMTLDAGAGFTLADGGALPASCRITLSLRPSARAEEGDGSFGLRIGSCELKFLPAAKMAQWMKVTRHAPSRDLPTLEEILAAEPYIPIWRNSHPNLPFKGGDFVIQNVEGLDRPFTLDLIVYYDPKSDSTIIDACIDNRRTMITRRPGVKVDRLQLFARLAQVEFRDLTVRPLV